MSEVFKNEIRVNINPPYFISVERGGLDKIGEYVRSATKANSAFVITDSNVNRYYGAKVIDNLKAAGFNAQIIVIPAGEQTKNARSFLSIIETLATMKAKRTDVVIALGGGVVGDIAGFAAATYMRGIDLIQVPTSLLAMIDSSIGGKTGVDLDAGKNLLGAFHQPKLVLIDPNVLETLPDAEWKNGLGEGVKYACLAGGEIMQIMRDGFGGKYSVQRFITLCAAYKANIVSQDEKESGLRKLLNLGHTLGHALEKVSDFKIPHGIAVANGLSCMAVAAFKNGELSDVDTAAIFDVLNKNDMLLDMPLTDEMFEAIRMDKKAESENEISVVTIAGIGNCIVKKMSFESFKEYILS